jgi:transcriptional regulator GlxA family with amidase domain
MQRISIIGLDGAFQSSIGVVLDLMELSGRYRLRQYAHLEAVPGGPGDRPVEVRLLTLNGGPVQLAGDRRLSSDGRIMPNQDFDAVFLPSFEIADEADLRRKLGLWQELYPWLIARHENQCVIAASGAATFVLAETGLLDRQLGTTPWWLEGEFRRRYPRVIIDTARTVTVSGNLCCTSTLQGDLVFAQRLVARLNSPNVAEWVRKIVFSDTYLYAPRSWDAPELHGNPPDPLVSKAQFWLQERFTVKVRIADLAEAMAVSERTLRRHFEAHIGMTPHDYLQNLRIEAAKQMLGRSRMRINRIAGLIGYGDVAFFKQVFRDRTGQSPSDYRRSYRDKLPS